MADIITVSSSDEEEVVTPPKKRIKPTPVLANLPNVTITKVDKKKEKKQDIVVLCSDDDDSGDQKDVEEEISCIDDNTVAKTENTFKSNGSSKENVIKICDDSTPQEAKQIINESIEINDIDIECIDDAELIKDLEDEDSCEIINEESEEESSGKENRSVDSAVLGAVPPSSSSSSGKPPNTILLDKLLKVIDDQTKKDRYNIVKVKFPMVLRYYNKCVEELGDSANFKNLLTSSIEKAEKSTPLAVISFNDIFLHLKESANIDSIEVDKEHWKQLKRLEKTIKNCLVIIKKLEDTEIDFDLEEDSSYLQLERYISRLDKVYKKYCKLLKKNPYCGRLTYAKLDFVDSEFNEINRAISKKYKNNNKFPSYYEMEKFVQKVVKENKLELSKSKIKSESVHCFKRLGELLQNRRRKELYDSHHTLIKDSEDPAKEDSELSKTLKNSYIEGQVKIEKLVTQFTNQQENKKDNKSEVSESDSDKSDYVDSEDEEENDEAGKG